MILAIRNSHPNPPGSAVVIGDIILGNAAAPAVDMATIRTPSFPHWHDIQNPNSGYRKLVGISEIHRGETRPRAEFDPAWDLIAMHTESSQPCVEEFKVVWLPAGVNFHQHFFLIFVIWETADRRSGMRYSPMSSSRGSSPLRSSVSFSGSSTGQIQDFLQQALGETHQSGQFTSQSSLVNFSTSFTQQSPSDTALIVPNASSSSGYPWNEAQSGQEMERDLYCSIQDEPAYPSEVPIRYGSTVSLNSPASYHQGTVIISFLYTVFSVSEFSA